MLRVTHIISGLGDGGAEGVLARICCATSSSQHQVISLTTEGKYGPILRSAGIPVTAVNLGAKRHFIRGFANLTRSIRQSHPDVVQTWMYHGDLLGGLAARLAGVKAVSWNIRHTELPVASTKKSTLAVAYLCALTSRTIPDSIVCCGDRALRVHARLGYSAKRMIVIKNGIDTRRFNPREKNDFNFRNELGINQNAFVVGYVSRFVDQKDHATLFRAMKIVRDYGVDAILVLVGAGLVSENEALMSMLYDLGIEENTFLCGPRGDIERIMPEMSIHVLSSSHGEGFPSVVAEAMACGTPCVVTDVGDSAAIVGETGWVVPPKQPDKLAEAILSAASAKSDTIGWQSRMEAARSVISDNFTLQTMISQYEKQWNEVFEKAAKQPRKSRDSEGCPRQ